jgi:hypothetical protein
MATPTEIVAPVTNITGQKYFRGWRVCGHRCPPNPQADARYSSNLFLSTLDHSAIAAHTASLMLLIGYPIKNNYKGWTFRPPKYSNWKFGGKDKPATSATSNAIMF